MYTYNLLPPQTVWPGALSRYQGNVKCSSSLVGDSLWFPSEQEPDFQEPPSGPLKKHNPARPRCRSTEGSEGPRLSKTPWAARR